MSFPTFPGKKMNQTDKPNIIMKDFFLKLIFSRVGPAVKAIVSAFLGWLVTTLASKGIMLDANLQNHIATALTGLFWLVIDFGVNKYFGDKVAIIQQAYGLEADRWLGPKTTAAAIDPKQIPKPTEILP
jgi:hypothetical protein